MCVRGVFVPVRGVFVCERVFVSVRGVLCMRVICTGEGVFVWM